MKNYYNVLEINSYEDSQDVILAKYKDITAKLSSQEINDIVKNRLIEINEAFLVLSDTDLKKKYDNALSTGIENDEIASAISEKRHRAILFIDSKLERTPKKRKRISVAAIICGALIIGGIGRVAKFCLDMQESAEFESVESYTAPESWTKFEFCNAFTISIPNTMKLPNEYEDYNRYLSDSIGLIDSNNAVFMPKALSSMSKDANGTYACVIVNYHKYMPGDLEHHNETTGLTNEDYRNLNKMAKNELDMFSFIDEPKWRWIDINGTKAIEGSYQRTGPEGPVNCKIYLLANYDEMAKIVVSYLEHDRDKWTEDLNNVIRTFKWNNSK